MAPRLSGQTSIFGVVFFVSKSLLGIERQKKLEKFAILTRKPRSHARILIYRTWPICSMHGRRIDFNNQQKIVVTLFVSFLQKRNGIVFSSGVNYLHSGGNIQSE